MSDSLEKKDAQTSNVLVWHSAEEVEKVEIEGAPEVGESEETESIEMADRPYWDLAGAELVYPLTIEEQGKEFDVYFVMTNFAVFETEKVRADSVAPVKVEGQEFETGRENPKSIIEFVDEHFVKMLGVSGDSQRHRDFLDERPYLKTRLWREVITRPGLHYEEDELPQDTDLISLSESPERWYELRPILYCPNRKVEAELKLRHCLRKSGQVDFNDFEKAVGGRYHTKLKEFRTTYDYGKLRQIYSNLVSSFEGYLVNGAACTEENKKWWLKKMPLDHILTVVDEAFSQVRSKNA